MHWVDPEGWDGEGGGGSSGWGTDVHPWLTHVNVWQKPLQYCNYPSIKIHNFFFLKNNGYSLGKGCNMKVLLEC